MMHLGIDLCKDFGGFLEEKWRHVGTKIEQKSMPTSKEDFLKKPCFSLGKTMILKVRGMEVGIKNRSIIDQKIMLTCEGILASIFHRFWWIWGAKLYQVGTKNPPKMDAKNHQKVKPQEKRLRTPKKPPRGPQNDPNEISWGWISQRPGPSPAPWGG